MNGPAHAIGAYSGVAIAIAHITRSAIEIGHHDEVAVVPAERGRQQPVDRLELAGRPGAR